MSTELTEHFIIVKGYIDAKDEQQRVVYGFFMGIVSRREMRYLRVAFGSDEIPKDTTIEELHALLEEHAKQKQPVNIERNETDLLKFFDVSLTLQGIARNLNVKHAEQMISRFCVEELQLKAVTFIEFVDTTEAYFSRFLPTGENAAEAPPGEAGESETPEDAEDGEHKEMREFVVRCDPVLDPVRGVAMSELPVGCFVCAKLPEDSVFYKLFTNNFQGFDGVVQAQVSGVLVNELGTATVSLHLADGISGVMRMRGRVRIKTAALNAAAMGRPFFRVQTLPIEVAFGLASIFILSGMIWLIIYLTP